MFEKSILNVNEPSFTIRVVPHCYSQWGRGKAASITFPISFTTECYIVNGNSQNYVDYTDHRNAYLYSKIQTLSASQFGPYWGASVEFWWFAVGY